MRCKRKISSLSSADVNPMMFFKVFLPDRSSQQLQLPSRFVKVLNFAFCPKSIFLRFGKRTWSVDVEEVGDTYFFQNGWSDFIQNSSLEPGDFMVFSYLGAARFSVNIYGKTGCEKNNAYALKKCKIEREDHTIVPQHTNVEELNRLVDDEQLHNQYALANYHGEEMNKLADNDELHDQYEQTNQSGDEMNKLANDEQLHVQSEILNQHGDEVNKLANNEQLPEQCEQTNQHGEDMNDSADEEQSTFEDSDYHYDSEGVSNENQKKKSRKKKSTSDKKAREESTKPKHVIWNGAGKKSRVPDVSYTSVYPHFKMGMLPVYISRASLNVPMPFAQKHMKPGKLRTALQALDKSWPVTLTTYTNGCCKISSGWLAFVRDNCVKVGDICVFELIDPKDFIFKVTIFPLCPS